MAAETLLALARIGHESSRDLFRARLTDGSPAVRRAAVEGLGRVRDKDSLDAVKGLMTSDRDETVRLAAAFAITLLADSQAHVLAGALASPVVGAQARDYLLELGAPAVPGVQSALGVATDGRARADLIHVLGLIGTRDQAPLVEPFTKDKDERVTRAAQNAMARLSGQTSGPGALRF